MISAFPSEARVYGYRTIFATFGSRIHPGAPTELWTLQKAVDRPDYGRGRMPFSVKSSCASQ